MALEELDLTKPGKIWATPEFESVTTFHIVDPAGGFVKEKLSVDGPTSVAKAHQLMDPFVVKHTELDKEGRAVLDLVQTKRNQAIMNNLEDRLTKGAPLQTIRALILAQHAEGNHLPDKFAVEMMDFSVASFPIITLLCPKPKVTALEVKGGTSEITAEFRATKPLNEVRVSITPAIDFEVNGQKAAGGALMVKVAEGQPYKVKVPITVDTKGITLLTPAQINDFNTRLQQNRQGGQLISDNGASYKNPIDKVPAALRKDGGTFPVKISQKLISIAAQYRTDLSWSRWRINPPYRPWNWKGPSGTTYSLMHYDGYIDVETTEAWDSKDFTLKVEGTGAYGGTSKTVALRLEGFMPKTQVDNPPRSFNHNAC